MCLPGSSLASSAVLPSSMSMSRTVLWPWFRGTGERREVRDAGLDKGLTKVLYLLTGSPARGYCVALFHYKDSARMNKCHGLVPAYPQL